MPNITIYLKDDEYVKFVQLNETEIEQRKEKAKQILIK
jgi:hypothetical protein